MLAAPGAPRLATRLLGADVSLPVLLGPAGLAGVMHPAGEPAVAARGGRGGHALRLAVHVEPPADARGGAGPAMFQLYALRDRADTDRLVDQAAAARAARCWS